MKPRNALVLRILGIAAPLLLASCMAAAPEGIAPSKPANTQVRMDFYDRPFPTVPLPNDLATRYDDTSATKRRVNASMVAPTALERRVRELLDGLDGWGIFQPITVPFTGPIDVKSILDAHRDEKYGFDDDVVYLVDVDRDSPKFGTFIHLDVGNGNYPVVLERSNYWKNDPRGDTISLVFEENDEDRNGNGVLDEGEDTDADGILDVPNYLPKDLLPGGQWPARDDLAGRADALMTFYEKETHTLIIRPMIPLDERTTYAVVVTSRIKDASGDPIGSPYEFVNHTAQTKDLEPLVQILPKNGLSMDDIAFAFTFTTQTVESGWIAVREGLYGHGVQKHIGEEFPAEINEIFKVRDDTAFPDMDNPHIMYTENWVHRFKDIYGDVFEQRTDNTQFASLEAAQRYIDYQVVGTIDSPQLFPRTDPDGKWLHYHDQVWPEDLDSKKVKVRGETVFFWLTVPRKEVSVRGQGKQAPIVVLSHGYGSSRIEALPFAGFFAKHGFATLAIDCVSHGIGISEVLVEAAEDIFGDAGLAPFVTAVLQDRSEDLNGDLERDSGADFWTSYLFHTRDVVRQSAVDYMQLIRVVRSFDGKRKWKFDVDRDGEPEVAGDFDGDGVMDIGAESQIGITGGSLGGIMSLVVGGLEPAIDVSVPIAGGGGLSDIGVRSQQGGVREAVILRTMAPVYTGDIDQSTGDFRISTIIPDLADDKEFLLGTTRNVKAGDTMVVENLVNGERDCGYVSADGTVRAAVASDLGDRTRILMYSGNVLVLGSTECELKEDSEPFATLDEFERQVYFQGDFWNEGDPLTALAEGYGLPRASSDLRRFMGLAQVILDPSDPAVMSRHMLADPIEYPESGQKTGAHVMIVTTVGDMNVPASSGLSLGRASGLLEYIESDPRFGKPLNQVLIDTYQAEAVNTFKRYTDTSSRGVHIDVENFSQGTDLWGTDIPRLTPPIRAGLQSKDTLGGYSGAIFPYAVPTGQHGFPFPGEQLDQRRKPCRDECRNTHGDRTGVACGCDQLTTFDTGFFMFNVLGKYFKSGGMAVDFDLCNSSDDCDGIPAAPPARPDSELR